MEVKDTVPRMPRVVEAPLRWRPPLPARLAMVGSALALALLVVWGILLASPMPTDTLEMTIRTGSITADRLAILWPFITVLLASGILVFIAIYHLARATFLIRGWQRYLLGLSRDLAERIARQARLVSLGYTSSARVAQAGTPGNPQSEPVENALNAFPRILLTGDDGAGKSTAIQRHALEIARGARLGSMVRGRQIVPLLVSVPRYMAAEPEPDGLRVEYLVAQVQQYGARMLASRLPALMRRGRVLLLLDGLDEVTPDQARALLRELATGLRDTYRHLRIIITCRTSAAVALAADDLLLRLLTTITLLPLTAEEIRQVLRRAGRVGQLGSQPPGGAGSTGEAIIAEIEQRDLLQIASSPAMLAMAIELIGAGQPLPATRARLLSAYEDLLFARAGIGATSVALTRRALGYLALALHLTGTAELSGVQAWNERLAVQGLLANTTSAANTIGGNSRPILRLDEVEISNALDTAVRVGILERGADRKGLRFRHSLLLFLAAARHLEAHDAGLGRVSPLLLRSEWIEILILWGGMTADATGLAERLSRFATTPAGVAAVARLGELERVEPLVHALALAIGVVSLTPLVTTTLSDKGEQARAEVAQQHLRDLFDRVLRYGVDEQDDTRRARLQAALRICESGTAGEMTPALARLVRSGQVNRILRAQAVQVLGLLASSASLVALTSLLLEQDPIVRDALSRGFHLAGAEAAEPLLDLIASYPAPEIIHKRAVDAIAAVDGPAVAPALARLTAAGPAARAAAAEALGAIRDRRALDPLLAATKDAAMEVQLAAIRALGKLGDLKAQLAILPLLQAPDEEQRIAAAEALGLMRSDRAMKPLIALLQDPRGRVRAAAAEALGHLGDMRAIDPLRQRLGDRDAWAQAAAATALRALGQRS